MSSTTMALCTAEAVRTSVLIRLRRLGMEMHGISLVISRETATRGFGKSALLLGLLMGIIADIKNGKLMGL